MQANIQNKSQMQIICKPVIRKLKNNTKAKNRLAYEFNKHITTIDRWLRDNDPMLTTPLGLKVISEELNIKAEDILTAA